MTRNTTVSRSMDLIRKMGGEPWKVDRYIGQAGNFGKTVDLYHLADLEALFPGFTLYVQVTSKAQMLDHVAKACHVELPRLKGERRPPRSALAALVACYFRVFEIWAWEKAGRLWYVNRMRAVVNAEGMIVFAPVSAQIEPPKFQETAMEVSR